MLSFTVAASKVMQRDRRRDKKRERGNFQAVSV